LQVTTILSTGRRGRPTGYVGCGSCHVFGCT